VNGDIAYICLDMGIVNDNIALYMLGWSGHGYSE